MKYSLFTTTKQLIGGILHEHLNTRHALSAITSFLRCQVRRFQSFPQIQQVPLLHLFLAQALERFRKEAPPAEWKRPVAVRSGGLFAPKDPYTREQSILTMYRLYLIAAGN